MRVGQHDMLAGPYRIKARRLCGECDVRADREVSADIHVDREQAELHLRTLPSRIQKSLAELVQTTFSKKLTLDVPTPGIVPRTVTVYWPTVAVDGIVTVAVVPVAFGLTVIFGPGASIAPGPVVGSVGVGVGVGVGSGIGVGFGV